MACLSGQTNDNIAQIPIGKSNVCNSKKKYFQHFLWGVNAKEYLLHY